MKKITLQLEQLTCPACVTKIQNKLDATEGLTNPKVLFNTSKVKAELDEEVLSADALVNLIEALGYEVESVK